MTELEDILARVYSISRNRAPATKTERNVDYLNFLILHCPVYEASKWLATHEVQYFVANPCPMAFPAAAAYEMTFPMSYTPGCPNAPNF